MAETLSMADESSSDEAVTSALQECQGSVLNALIRILYLRLTTSKYTTSLEY
jgi:hypothetical protein